MTTTTTWTDQEPAAQAQLRSGLGESVDLFALLCQRRGWTDTSLARLNDDSHAPLKDVDTMVEALHSARTQGQVVTIAPDFDMDGISSGVLGYAGLAELGFAVNLHLPDYNRGHDLTAIDIAEIDLRFPDTSVLLTCDGGVNSHDGVRAAQRLGWKVLVTDHHQELEPGCSADVTVNPCRMDETYELRGICGAHVLWQVLHAYAQTHRPDKLWSIQLLRLFAGLGTVSDVMPVVRENRAVVRDSVSIARLLYVAAPRTIENRWGDMDPDPDAIDVGRATLLQLLRAAPQAHDPVFVSVFEGFAVLLKAFAQVGKLREVDDLDEGFYGFYLAPAMNSPRRIQTPLADCFAVFTAAEVDQKLAAAHRIIANNERRKELVVEHLRELTEPSATLPQPHAPWVYFSLAPAGMFGLLANQMMQANGHPVVVVNRPDTDRDAVGGSGRAPEWFDIIATLDDHNDPDLFAIGHQQACGVKLASPDLLPVLAELLRRATDAAMTAGETTGAAADLVLGTSYPELGPGFTCDASLGDPGQLLELVRRVETLKPFGHGFPEPVIELILDPVFRVETIGQDKQHLRLITREGMTVLWWNAAEAHADRLADLVTASGSGPHGPVRLLGRLQVNTFMNLTRVQFVVSEELL